jgi:hypothetical protein
MLACVRFRDAPQLPQNRTSQAAIQVRHSVAARKVKLSMTPRHTGASSRRVVDDDVPHASANASASARGRNGRAERLVHLPAFSKKLAANFSQPRASQPVNANMELLPAHQPLREDDTDEELSDEQIRELLDGAAQRMRAKQPVTRPDAPFKLPKLRPGHISDTYEKTEGNITRLDHSKLIDEKQQALANGIKKIEDPIALKRQRKEVCTHNHHHPSPPVMISIPNIFPEADSGSVLDAFLHL